jgi:hypothetical protein
MTFAYLLLALDLLNIRQVPAGTPLHLRLTTPVGSYASRAGAPVRAVLIAPVMAGGEMVLPEASTLSGTVKSVRRVGLGVWHETASLSLEFSGVTLPDGENFPISARVAQVDNGRERVDQDGSIRGVRATRSLTYRASGYIRTALQWEVHAAIAVWAIKALVREVPEPEIYYPAGVELTLALTEPLVSAPYPEAVQAPRRLTEDERAQMDSLVAGIPYRAYAPVSGRPSDLTNVLLVGSRDQLAAAFVAAGWVEARAASLRSSLTGIRAVAEGLGYRAAPMSALLFHDAEPDWSWQKSFNDVSKRHHIRLWNLSETWDGDEVWIGAATRDIDFAYLRPGHPFTHRIEENVDSEREKVVHDLVFTSCVDLTDGLERPSMPHFATNGTGDRMHTDTRLAVIRLNGCAAPRIPALPMDAAGVAAHGNKVERFVRREILSARSDLLRDNPYFRGYEGARWLIAAMRRHEREISSDAELTPASRFTHSVFEWLR